MVRIHEIKVKAGKADFSLEKITERALRLPSGSIKSVLIVKESVDAREKPVIYRVFSVDINSDLPEEAIIDAAKRNHYKWGQGGDKPYIIQGKWENSRPRPIVCGFGPCGIFAALVLARAGAKPIILEKGLCMESRIAAVEEYWKGGKLNPLANVQVGEGGAGTFSDGKLTTLTKNPAQRYVLEAFVKAGANPEILYKQKPHIGTEVIRSAVVALRKEIESLGGEFHFAAEFTGFETVAENGAAKLCKVFANSGQGPLEFAADTCLMALGHSARSSFYMLQQKGLLLQQKPFSIGIRVEHFQKDIDMAQYGCLHQDLGLGAAEYKLNCRVGDRGVYTFCMCPGGEVVDSSSEEGYGVTNGMSYSARAGEFANSAVLCDVRPADFESENPLAGIEFQQKYEALAYKLGNGRIVKGEKAYNALPEFASVAIKQGLKEFNKKIKGFNKPVQIYGVESRSSSPVRIKRDAEGNAFASNGINIIKGLKPCGEGAGYAGGIMSAAVDGIKMAELALEGK